MLLLKLVRGAERASGVQPLVQVPARQPRFVIGRDPKCDWPINDRELALSARHCEIVVARGQMVLRDLSTNGTFVNGVRITETRLFDGMAIRCGSTELRFLAQ